MRLLPEKTTLVIAGAFNPAILSPAWIAKNVLGLDEDHPVQVELFTSVGSPAHPLPVRYSFAGITYSASAQRLAFGFEGLDANGAVKVIRTVRKIFELLPHTPVTAVGFNFGFSDTQLSAKLATLLSSEVSLLDGLDDQGASIVMQSWGNGIRIGDELVSVACKFDSAELTVDINAHRDVNDAAALVAALTADDVFASHLSLAESIATSLNEGALR